MSEPDLEEQKKAVLPFMQRAQEIQAADPKVAYYCRMYSVDQALKFEKRAKEINGLLGAALAQMEKDKPKLGLDKENDRYYCEAFALKIFGNADRVDRAGRADLNTSKAFYASSFFFEILNQFGPMDEELLGKQRYAAWRAAEIRKAVREGRPPVPPPGKETEAAAGADLPPFEAGSSGSENWGASQPPPPAVGPPSAGVGPSGFGADLPPAQPAAAPPPAPPSLHSDSLPQAPSAAVPPGAYGALPPMGSWSAAPPPPRFGPGSQVLYKEVMGRGEEPQVGTVGQVYVGGGGENRYKVALRSRLVDAIDPELSANITAEGQRLAVMQVPGGALQPATAVLMNDITWPPTYLVRLPDGSEISMESHQVFLRPEAEAAAGAAGGQRQVAAAPPPQNPPAPPGPSYPSLHSSAGPAAPPPQPPSSHPGSSHAPAAAPPPQAPRPAAPAAPQYAPPAPAPAPAPAQPAVSAAAAPPPGWKPSVAAIAEAQKNAKYAVSSLNFEDIHAAVKYLQTALKVLTQPH